VLTSHASARPPGVCLLGEKTSFPLSIHALYQLPAALPERSFPHLARNALRNPATPASNHHSKPIGSGIPDPAPAAYF
jgi:hypothetical protein